MLGLSLAIRVGKRVLGGLIDSLMSAIKGRATYSENIADSKQVVKDIDNYELLDKASILLTPTAYSDARVHSVKTYTGDELITNGGFDTDSDWTKGTGWTIANGKASNDGSSGSNNLTQGGVLVVGKNYKITITVSDYVSGNVEVSAGASPRGTMSANGTYTFYQTCTPATSFYIIANAFEGSMDNVSVTEADADFDFDRASSATRINSDGLVQDMQSITDPELVLNGDFEELSSEYITNGDFSDGETGWTKGGAASATQSVVNGALVMYAGSASDANNSLSRTNTPQGYNGKTYKLELTVSDMLVSSVGFIRLDSTYDASNIISFGTGTSTIYFTAYRDFTHIRFFAGSAEDGYTIDNVSVQQVDPNDRWSIEGESYIDSGKGVIYSTGNFSALRQTILISGRTYRLNFDIVDSTQGSVKIGYTSGGGEIVASLSGVGSYEYNFEANGTLLDIARFSGATDISIDNISVKDITFSEDVDLARINYDSNGDNGHWLLEPTSTNLVTYSEDFSEWTLGSNATLSYESDVVAPDGSLGVYRLTLPAASSTFILAPFFANSNPLTVSVYAKSTGSGNDSFNLYTGATNVSDLNTTTSEWQRFDYTADGSSMYIINDGDTYTSDIYIWGAQAEALSYATSYIPTYGSTVTRATETLTGSGNSTLINSTEGVLYAEIAALSTTDGSGNISLSDGTGNNRIYIYYLVDDAISVIHNINSSGAVINNFTLSDITSYTKIAARWGNSKFSVWINGTEVLDVAASNFTSNTLDLLNLAKPDGTGQLQGKCKALAVFNEALEVDELELLTGITNYGSFNELAQANGYTII